MGILDTEVKVIESLISARKYSEALARCATTLEQHPKSRRVRRLQARVKYHLGDYSGAISDANEIVQLEPKEPDGYFNRGRYFLKSGCADRAVADFTEVLKLSELWHSDYYVEAALLFRAEALIRCQRYREARQDCMQLPDLAGVWIDSFRTKEAMLADCDAGEGSGERAGDMLPRPPDRN